MEGANGTGDGVLPASKVSGSGLFPALAATEPARNFDQLSNPAVNPYIQLQGGKRHFSEAEGRP